MSQTPDPNDPSDDSDATIDLTPEKTGLLETLPADLDEPGALKEIIDNSLDAWERVNPPFDKLEVEITYDEDSDTLIIRDNAGGAKSDDISRFFALGASNPGDGVQTRGAYGVGLKKAALRLSSEITFATRHYEDTEGTGRGFTITEEWLQRDEDWSVSPETFDIDAGVTEIRLSGLKFDWDEKEVAIRNSIRSAYRQQLGGGPFDADRQCVITINDKKLNPPEGINYGYPALDGLHPREFYSEIKHPDLDAPLEVRIVVGLLAEKRNKEAGTDIYIQGRLVHETADDEQGGFGVKNGLGSLNKQSRGRFRAALSIESEAPAEQLPWNTTKDRLFPDERVMKGVWDFFRRCTDRYYDATFGKVPQAFLRFPKENEWAYNDGTIDVVGDQTKRDRITAKPTEGYPEVQTVRTHAEAHAKLGIFYKDAVLTSDDTEVQRTQKTEAYKSLVDDSFEPVESLRSPQTVGAIPPDFAEYDDISADAIREELESDAEQHSQIGVRYTGHEPWKQPLYDALLERHVEDISTLEDVEERPDPDEGTTGGDKGGEGGSEDTHQLSITVTESELEDLQEYFGDIQADSPEKRGEKVLQLVQQIRSIQTPMNK